MEGFETKTGILEIKIKAKGMERIEKKVISQETSTDSLKKVSYENTKNCFLATSMPAANTYPLRHRECL